MSGPLPLLPEPPRARLNGPRAPRSPETTPNTAVPKNQPLFYFVRLMCIVKGCGAGCKAQRGNWEIIFPSVARCVQLAGRACVFHKRGFPSVIQFQVQTIDEDISPLTYERPYMSNLRMLISVLGESYYLTKNVADHAVGFTERIVFGEKYLHSR